MKTVTGILGAAILLVAGGDLAGWENQSDDQKTKIEALAVKSKTARTAAEFGDLVSQCESILQSDLEKKYRQYLTSLKSWALNRRGEIRLEIAEQMRRVANAAQAELAESKALEDFESAIESDPKRWRAIMNRGIVKFQRGGLAEALDDFIAVTQLNPQAQNGWFNCAEIQYETQDYESALASYAQAIQRQPDDVQALTGRAHTQFQLGEIQKALSDYDKVVQYQGDQAWAWANRADARLALGMYEDAYRDYQRALQAEGVGAIYQRMGWMLATCPENEFYQPEMALILIQKAIELDGQSAKYLDTLAAAYAANGDFEAARAKQLEAIELENANEQFQLRKAMYEKNEVYQHQRLRR